MRAMVPKLIQQRMVTIRELGGVFSSRPCMLITTSHEKLPAMFAGTHPSTFPIFYRPNTTFGNRNDKARCHNRPCSPLFPLPRLLLPSLILLHRHELQLPFAPPLPKLVRPKSPSQCRSPVHLPLLSVPPSLEPPT